MILLTINYSKLPRLMLNGHLVKADSYYHIYVTAFLFSQCMHCYALKGYVKNEDIKAATVLLEVGPNEVEDLAEDWDSIYV